MEPRTIAGMGLNPGHPLLVGGANLKLYGAPHMEKANMPRLTFNGPRLAKRNGPVSQSNRSLFRQISAIGNTSGNGTK